MPPVQAPNYQDPHLAGSVNQSFQQPPPPNNVASYQQPQNSYPPAIGPYHGTKGPSQSSQWNNSQPRSSHSASPYPQQQGFHRDRSVKRESATPQMQSQSQQLSNTPRVDNRSNINQPPPQVCKPNQKSAPQDMPHTRGADCATDSTSVSDVEMMAEPESDVAMSIESKAPSVQPSSRASTPFAQHGRRESEGGLSQRSGGFHSTSISVRRNSVDEAAFIKKKSKKSQVEPPRNYAEKQAAKDEGELSEQDLRNQEFNWEYQKIFQSPAPFEFVALAQPLSAKYSETATPVPLLNEKDRRSVSRYARNDNLEEFLKPVRTQSQWSYLQEDPGFLEVTRDGPLIPLDEVPTWMAKRHGEDQQTQENEEVLEDREEPSSRKRVRSADDEEGIENCSQDGTAAEDVNGDGSNKRVKLEATDENTIVQIKDADGAPGTPTLARDGSQFGDEDDVWAPQPGESAAAEANSTEAILASLGVTGSPKPVRSQSISGGSVHESAAGGSRYGSVVHSMSPAEFQAIGMPPHAKSALSGTVSHSSTGRKRSGSGIGPQQNTPQGYTHGTPPQNNGFPHNDNTQQGYGHQGPPNSSFPQQGFSHHAPPLQSSHPQNQNFRYPGPYHEGPPQTQHFNGYAHPNQYPNDTSSQHHQHYPNAPYRQPSLGNSISPQSNGPFPNQQFGPPQNSFGSSVAPQGIPPYANSVPYQQYTPQNYPGNEIPPQGQVSYGGMPAQNDGVYGNTPYPPGPPSQWGHGPQNPPHNLPPYGGPPQPFYNGGHSSGGNPYYGAPHNIYSPGDQQYLPQQPGMYSQQGISPQGPYPPFNNMPHGNQPPRQDSGYTSARGSYSNGNESGPGHEMNGYKPAQPLKHHSDGQIDGPSDERHPVGDSTNQGNLSQVKTEDTASDDEQALSPISREILGKTLSPKKKPEPMRQPDDGGTARRKPKRPQPEVAPAYRYNLPFDVTNFKY